MPARPPLILPDVTRLQIGLCPGAYSTNTHFREGESLADDLYHERGIVRSRAASLLRSTEIQPLFVRFVRYHYIIIIYFGITHHSIQNLYKYIFPSPCFLKTRARAYADETHFPIGEKDRTPRPSPSRVHAPAKPGLVRMRMRPLLLLPSRGYGARPRERKSRAERVRRE